MPLHTLRADINYGFAEAHTTLRHHRREGVDLPRRGAQPAGGGAARSPPARRPDVIMLAPKKVKCRKSRRAAASGTAWRGSSLAFGDFGLQVARPRLAHGAPDRGGPRRDHPRHQARRPRLGPRVPRQAAHQEAGRDPHGQGQGRARGLGGGREAGPHALRDGRRRARRPRARRSSWRRPSCRCRRSSASATRVMAGGAS